MGRLIGIVLGGLVGLVLLVVVTVVIAVSAVVGDSGDDGQACMLAGTPGRVPAGLSADQAHNAAVIVAVGRQQHVPTYGWVIAVAVALQESNLLVLANPAVPASMTLPHQGTGDDHDSVGLFQQRPSWGSTAELMDPAASSKKFYTKLTQVPGWQHQPLTEVAQAVQVSAFPDAYAKHEARARAIVAALSGAVCGPVSLAGWVRPAPGQVVSGFRTPQRPDHDGVDIAAPRGTTIRAASAGTVVTAMCDPGTGNCDIDGSESTPGCGWYVEIRHPGNLVTRYCHMLRRPTVHVGQTVTAGQPLGVVGMSGNASGPHVHFEVHTGYPATRTNAIDPVKFMDAHGVKF